jgi:hypothetical protein
MAPYRNVGSCKVTCGIVVVHNLESPSPPLRKLMDNLDHSSKYERCSAFAKQMVLTGGSSMMRGAFFVWMSLALEFALLAEDDGFDEGPREEDEEEGVASV